MQLQDFTNLTNTDLKKMRKEKKLLQREVAEIVGVSKQTINNWENERGLSMEKKLKLYEIYK